MMGIFKKAVEIIKNGGVVIAPTDTVYGLICDAANKKAVEKIFKIKKRPKSKPLPIFVKDLKMAKEIAEIDRKQEKFLKKVWPGKVTARLERKKSKIKLYGVDKDTIAIRIPKYRLLLGLAEQLNRPLAQTSANISGKIAPAKIQEILKQFSSKKYQPDLVIDAGDLPQNKPSKIIDLTIWPPKILRP
ncbi:MAG: L-threonylcarbamoyladenylate synthase [bacterium]